MASTGINSRVNFLNILENLPEVAGAVRLELTTVGFGDRCSTIRTMPLQNCRAIIYKRAYLVKSLCKNN